MASYLGVCVLLLLTSYLGDGEGEGKEEGGLVTFSVEKELYANRVWQDNGTQAVVFREGGKRNRAAGKWSDEFTITFLLPILH